MEKKQEKFDKTNRLVYSGYVFSEKNVINKEKDFMKKILVAMFFGILLGAQAQDTVKKATDWEWCGWGGGGYFWSCAIDPADADTMYIGGDVAGCYKTTDGGKLWNLINIGINNYAVYGMAISKSSPQTLYIMTENGMCKTVNGGELWMPLDQTLKNNLDLTAKRRSSVRPIAIDPQNADIVYAGSQNGYLYKSTDGGNTWNELDYIQCLTKGEKKSTPAFSGKGALAANILMPRASWKNFGRTEVVYGDNSQNWTNYSKITAQVFVPEADADLDAQISIQSGSSWTWQNGTWKTLKNKAWNELDFPMDKVKDASQIKAAYVVFRSKSKSYSGTVFIDCVALKGKDGTEEILYDWETGTSTKGWRVPNGNAQYAAVKSISHSSEFDMSQKVSGIVSSISIAEKDPKTIFMSNNKLGVFKSENAGETWSLIQDWLNAVAVTIAPSDKDTVYAGLYSNEIYKSIDGGRNWLQLTNDIPLKFKVREIVVSPKNINEVIIAGENGWNGCILNSTDGGKTWTANTIYNRDLSANPTLPEDISRDGTHRMSRPANIAISSRNPEKVLIAANWANLLSSDGGKTWDQVDRGLDISCITDIEFCDGDTYVSVMDEGVLKSSDDGKTWKQLWPLKYSEFSGHYWQLGIIPTNNTRKIISTFSEWGNQHPASIVISYDDGASFSEKTKGLPTETITADTMWGRGYMRGFSIAKDNPNIVYVGLDGKDAGIFKSVDGGESWKRLENQPKNTTIFYGLEVDPTNSQRIFWGANKKDGGVYRSEDGGDTWEHVLKDDAMIWNIKVTDSGIVYAGGKNLWQSKDHGDTWKKVTDFTDLSVVGLTYDDKNENIVWFSRVSWSSNAIGGIYQINTETGELFDILGNSQYVRPLVLEFNNKTRELWAGGVCLFKTKIEE